MPSKQRRVSSCKKLADSPLFEMHRSTYLFTEVTSLTLFIVSCIISWQLPYGTLYSIIVFVCIFHISWFLALIIFMPKLTKPNPNWYKKQHKIPEFKEKIVKTKDYCNLKYYLSELFPKDTNRKNNKKIICLAPLLGQNPQSFNVYDPLISHLGTDDYIYITWDYRGFFGSNNKNKYKNSNDEYKVRDISIHEFASDMNEILTAECIECIDYCIGHSLGVQVCLEFAVSYPNKINSMILLNGSHGSVFNTAFQPVLRIPFIGDIVAELVSFMLNHDYLMQYVKYFALQPIFKWCLNIYAKIFGSELLRRLYGKHYLSEFLEQYLSGICNCNESLYHWFRAFQELHSHSVYHLLDKINHPTLIISGLWDILVPCLLSFEMARKLPNAKHCCDIYSSHATILENPEYCVYEIVSFIKNTDLLKRHINKNLKVHHN